mgnify:CR=1 FL=1
MATRPLMQPRTRGNPTVLPSDKPRRLTPLRAIRAKCLWCCAGSTNEVKLCPAEGCPLHEYRAGHRPEAAKLTPIKAIRAKCRDCYGLSWADVQSCPGLGLADGPCPLHAFRLGKNPYLSEEARVQRQANARKHRFGRDSTLHVGVEQPETENRATVHPDVILSEEASLRGVSRASLDESGDPRSDTGRPASQRGVLGETPHCSPHVFDAEASGGTSHHPDIQASLLGLLAPVSPATDSVNPTTPVEASHV